MRDDSPWVVTALALEDARCAAPAQDMRTPLPYLVEDDRRVLCIHWSPYDRVRVVNADP
jgi:hypothetical protein